MGRVQEVILNLCRCERFVIDGHVVYRTCKRIESIVNTLADSESLAGWKA